MWRANLVGSNPAVHHLIAELHGLTMSSLELDFTLTAYFILVLRLLATVYNLGERKYLLGRNLYVVE